METYQIIILALFFGLVVLEILFTNFFSKHNQRSKDGVVELFGFFPIEFFGSSIGFWLWIWTC
jgi:hypothetical protein